MASFCLSDGHTKQKFKCRASLMHNSQPERGHNRLINSNYTPQDKRISMSIRNKLTLSREG